MAGQPPVDYTVLLADLQKEVAAMPTLSNIPDKVLDAQEEEMKKQREFLAGIEKRQENTEKALMEILTMFRGIHANQQGFAPSAPSPQVVPSAPSTQIASPPVMNNPVPMQQGMVLPPMFQTIVAPAAPVVIADVPKMRVFPLTFDDKKKPGEKINTAKVFLVPTPIGTNTYRNPHSFTPTQVEVIRDLLVQDPNAFVQHIQAAYAESRPYASKKNNK